MSEDRKPQAIGAAKGIAAVLGVVFTLGSAFQRMEGIAEESLNQLKIIAEKMSACEQTINVQSEMIRSLQRQVDKK